jgi:15-cis-phytoene synthase
MTPTIYDTIFKNSSKTFYYATSFFPVVLREKIAILYAFVRVVDNFVDQPVQDRIGFYIFLDAYDKAKKVKNPESYRYLENIEHDTIVKSYIKLERENNFDPAWTNAFIDSMEADLNKKSYTNMNEAVNYMYGSASVIGLMMCRLLGLVDDSLPFAKTLGTAFQYINFIRDIDEDHKDFGRVYIPMNEINKYGFSSLEQHETRKQPEKFRKLMLDQITYFREWQKEGLKGLKFMPRQYAIAIKTAADNYEWTAQKLEQNPYLIYSKKVKPGRSRVLMTGLKNTLFYY